jgi:signal peptidase
VARKHRLAAALALLGVATPFLAFTVPALVGASHSYVEASSSMAPAIEEGDAVFVETVNPDTIGRGDIITFRPSEAAGLPSSTVVTHRVVAVSDRSGERYFRTKGDANDAPDAGAVPAGRVVGRVKHTVPYLGTLVRTVGIELGVVVFVALPALALVVLEVRALVSAARYESARTELSEWRWGPSD